MSGDIIELTAARYTVPNTIAINKEIFITSADKGNKPVLNFTATAYNLSIKNSKNGFILNTETRNKGDYNVEFLTITNSNFDNISGSILDYHRGGYDESTIGDNLVFNNNTVTNSGKMQNDSILIKNRGIVNLSLKDNTFKNNPVKLVAILWGEKGQKPENNTITNSGEVKVVKNLKLKLMY